MAYPPELPKTNSQKEPSGALFPKEGRKAKRKIPRNKVSESMKKALKKVTKKKGAKKTPTNNLSVKELRAMMKENAPRYETTLGRRVKIGGGPS